MQTHKCRTPAAQTSSHKGGAAPRWLTTPPCNTTAASPDACLPEPCPTVVPACRPPPDSGSANRAALLTPSDPSDGRGGAPNSPSASGAAERRPSDPPGVRGGAPKGPSEPDAAERSDAAPPAGVSRPEPSGSSGPGAFAARLPWRDMASSNDRRALPPDGLLRAPPTPSGGAATAAAAAAAAPNGLAT
eukprot:351810-Chlamydomonas_euryale.AAC.1